MNHRGSLDALARLRHFRLGAWPARAAKDRGGAPPTLPPRRGSARPPRWETAGPGAFWEVAGPISREDVAAGPPACVGSAYPPVMTRPRFRGAPSAVS